MSYRLLISLALLPLLASCVFSGEQIRDEVDSIAWDLRPAELETQAELRIGRGLLGMATTVARWSDDPAADFAAYLIDDIDQVDAGIYELFYRTHGGRDQMLVVGIEDGELIVLRLTGDLGGILDNAIRREDDLIHVAHNIHDDY